MSGAKSTETFPANSQKLTFCQVGLRDAFVLPTASHVESDGVICIGFAKVVYSLLENGPGIVNIDKERFNIGSRILYREIQ